MIHRFALLALSLSSSLLYGFDKTSTLNNTYDIPLFQAHQRTIFPERFEPIQQFSMSMMHCDPAKITTSFDSIRIQEKTRANSVQSLEGYLFALSPAEDLSDASDLEGMTPATSPIPQSFMDDLYTQSCELEDQAKKLAIQGLYHYELSSIQGISESTMEIAHFYRLGAPGFSINSLFFMNYTKIAIKQGYTLLPQEKIQYDEALKKAFKDPKSPMVASSDEASPNLETEIDDRSVQDLKPRDLLFRGRELVTQARAMVEAASQLLQEAANQKDQKAMISYANRLIKMRDLEKTKQALMLYKEAAYLGSEEACEKLRVIYDGGKFLVEANGILSMVYKNAAEEIHEAFVKHVPLRPQIKEQLKRLCQD